MDSKLTGSDAGNIAPWQCLDASLERRTANEQSHSQSKRSRR